MYKILIEGYLLGISTGSLCLLTCTPIYLPYLISEDRKLSKSIFVVLEISAGRFFSYLIFGALAGYTGAQISSINRQLFTSIAYILLSSYLVLSAVRTRNKQKKCHVPKMAMLTKSAFVLGVLTGINFCPSFLIALSKAVNLGGASSGMLLFLGFFFGTSLYLIPLAFIGQISKINKMKMLAQIASILIAFWFTFSGVKGIIHYFEHQTENENVRYVKVFNPENGIIIISSENNWEYFSGLRDSLQKYSSSEVTITEGNAGILKHISSQDILFLDDEESIIPYEKFDYFVVENGYNISNIIKFLKQYTFKTSTNLHWDFVDKK